MPRKIGEMELYNVEELSELLGISIKTVRQLIKEGTIEGRKLARRWYVTSESLQAFFRKPGRYELEDVEHLETAGLGARGGFTGEDG